MPRLNHPILDDLPSDQLDKLEIYADLLAKWQAKINLISKNTLDDAWQRHFADSAQLAALIPEESKILFDLGSGAGFPGMVLAILRPDLEIHLVESDQKKCAFLQNVSRETNCAAHIHNQRIENVSRETIPDVVSARALSSLAELLNYCQEWISLKPNLSLIFPKGENYAQEIEIARKTYDFEVEVKPSQTDENGHILMIQNVRKCA